MLRREFALKRRTRLSTLGVMWGLAVLLTAAMAGCDDAEPNSAIEPTKLDKIENLHSTDTIDTENSGTRGRPIWVHSSQVGKADSKWVCHVVPAYPNVSPGPMNGSILLRWA